VQKNIFQKIWPITKKHKVLRTLCLLCVIFLLLICVFFALKLVYANRIEVNKKQIAKNEQELTALQRLILDTQNKNNLDISLFQDKSFASYDEVVPFIALLEKMFEKIDPKAEIVVKSQEDQIFIDHFADYNVKLKINDKDAFFKALQELNDSRFIIKIMNFMMQYKTDETGKKNDLDETEFIIRLFLK